MSSPDLAPTGATILLVEDDDAIRPVLRRALERQGYRLLLASSGEEALEIAESQDDGEKVDLVITDLMMPGIGGVELLERLTRRFPNTRALLMSGYSDEALVRAGLPGGRAAFLQKPFTLDELSRRVREVLAS